MADDDQHNPYAPPAGHLAAKSYGDADDRYGPEGMSTYESERRPVIMAIVLTVVTLGIYPAVWLMLRRPFLDRLDSHKKLGSSLPVFVLVATVLGFALAFGGKELTPIRTLVTLGGGVIGLIARFRVLHILRSDSSRTGRFLEFSSLATFFLGIYYLQYKLNQLADTPARAERPRRTKKRKTGRVVFSADDAPAAAPATTDAAPDVSGDAATAEAPVEKTG